LTRRRYPGASGSQRGPGRKTGESGADAKEDVRRAVHMPGGGRQSRPGKHDVEEPPIKAPRITWCTIPIQRRRGCKALAVEVGWVVKAPKLEVRRQAKLHPGHTGNRAACRVLVL
jgi:hypothetical protein